MNQQSLSSHREHHFYVAISKFLFHHPEYGIVTVADPIRIKDAKQYGLNPIILYGLTVAGFPIKWMTFSTLDQPRAFRNVLLEAWHNADGLRGCPDVLWINRHLATAAPGLVPNMAKFEVIVKITDAKDKFLPASLRSAQNDSDGIPRRFYMMEHVHIESIQTLCMAAQYDHDIQAKRRFEGLYKSNSEDKMKHWLTLPTQKPKITLSGELDWELGPWLSSWEASLPPNKPRYFFQNWGDGNYLLKTGSEVDDANILMKTEEDKAEEIIPPKYNDTWGDNFHDNAAQITQNLVACWPNPPLEIAKCLGITLRKLNWFTSGKGELDQKTRFKLEELLSIRCDEKIGEYIGVGPYVLIAKKQPALRDAYESITNGGEAGTCEVVPYQSTADPSWRYVFISMNGRPPSIIMSPRGEKITERLSKLLINYRGITSVPPEFYQDIVLTCGRACREPVANYQEMAEFVKRYEEHWYNFCWQYE